MSDSVLRAAAFPPFFRHYQDVPHSLRGGVLALGNFDGVHRGHCAVLEEAKRIAQHTASPSGAFTFFPHPLSVLAPTTPRLAISTVRQKYQHMVALSLDMLLAQHFTPAFSQLSGERFIEEVLCEGLGVSHVVIGYDFIFGHKRSGNAALLQRYADQGAFGFTQVPAFSVEEQVVSSSRIREALMRGDIPLAEELLGHGYAIEGRVVRGAGKAGPLLGVPTANIPLKGSAFPAFGVYRVNVTLQGRGDCFPGIANIGVKPSFGNKMQPLLEVHLFDQVHDLYGKRLSVRLLEFMRPERQFENLEALKAQIQKDIALCK